MPTTPANFRDLTDEEIACVFGGYSSETVSEEARNDFISAGYGVVDSDYSGDGWTMETGEAGFSGWGFAINPTLGLVGNQSCQVN